MTFDLNRYASTSIDWLAADIAFFVAGAGTAFEPKVLGFPAAGVLRCDDLLPKLLVNSRCTKLCSHDSRLPNAKPYKEKS